MKVFVALALLCSAHVESARTASTMSPVIRIVKMLEEMQTKLEKDKKAEEDVFNKYLCWAKNAVAEKESAIKEAQSKVDQLSSYIDDIANGRIEFTTERVDLEKEAAKLEGQLSETTATCDTQLSDFESAKAEMEAAIAGLEQAVQVLDEATKDTKSSSLVAITSSTGFGTHAAEAASLRHAADLGDKILSKGDARFLRRLLTGDVQPADQKTLNRKATFKMDYKARSGKIQKMLADLLEQTKDDLKDATDKSANDQDNCAEMKKSLNKQLNSANAALKEGSSEGSTREEAKTQAQDEKDALETQINDDKKFNKDTQKASSEQETLFLERQQLRMQELSGVGKAIAILSADDARDLFRKSYDSQGYFLMQTRRNAARRAQFESVEELDARSIQSLLRRRDVNMGSVADQVDKVIADVIQKKDDTFQTKDDCIQNMTNLNHHIDEQQVKIDDLEKEKAGINKEIENEEQEISARQSEILATKDEIAKATEDRAAEKAEYESAKSDDQEAAKVLGQAIKVLAETYATKLLQDKKQPKEGPFEGSYEAKENPSITMMLKAAKDDIEKDIRTATEQEGNAVKDFEKAKAGMNKHIGNLVKEIEVLEGEKATLLTERTDCQGRIDAETDAQNASKDQLAAIKPDCDYVINNFDKLIDALDKERKDLEAAKTQLMSVNKKKLR